MWIIMFMSCSRVMIILLSDLQKYPSQFKIHDYKFKKAKLFWSLCSFFAFIKEMILYMRAHKKEILPLKYSRLKVFVQNNIKGNFQWLDITQN